MMRLTTLTITFSIVNPYRKLITDLMNKGGKVELCGATARTHGWENSETIPGIKITTDAMARAAQLVQEGFRRDSGSWH
jgi:intracellular sulfur oxidation DsrE/DsrF family protein